MELRPFGSPARQVPVLGLGTWNLEQGDRASAIAALRRGVDLGLTHVDTDEMYGSGKVEAIVGEALRPAGARHRRLVVGPGPRHHAHAEALSTLSVADHLLVPDEWALIDWGPWSSAPSAIRIDGSPLSA